MRDVREWLSKAHSEWGAGVDEEYDNNKNPNGFNILCLICLLKDGNDSEGKDVGDDDEEDDEEDGEEDDEEDDEEDTDAGDT